MSCRSTKDFVGKAAEPGDPAWMISDRLHKELQERLHECGLFKRCRTPQYFDSSNRQYNYLRDKYPTAIITTEEVRYRRADQETYAKLWGLSSRAEAAQVRGYKTRILKITVSGDKVYNYDRKKNSKGGDDVETNRNYEKPLALTTYSYYGKICPPPKACLAKTPY